MRVEKVGIADVIPYEFNNRDHGDEQVNRIANSIHEFGFNQPIVVDENNIVLVGHGRLSAARKLGLVEVPVVKKTELTDAQKKAYRILDNKLQNDSTWNFDSLELELAALRDADFNLDAYGLDDLEKLFPAKEADVCEDQVPVERDSTIIKFGDIIELGVHRVMCGDATKPELVETLFEGGGAGRYGSQRPSIRCLLCGKDQREIDS